MRKLFVALFYVTNLPYSSIAHASCIAEYDSAIQSEYNQFSFAKETDSHIKESLNNIKNKMYYNDGEGASLGKSILVSTGRVATTSAVGATVGFVAPYVAAGLTLGAPIVLANGAILVITMGGSALVDIGNYALSEGGMEGIHGTVTRALWKGLSGPANAIISITPYTAVIGAGVAGIRSIVLSVKDSHHAVKINKFYHAKTIIHSAIANDRDETLSFYKTLKSETRSHFTLEDIMNQISKLDQETRFCRDGKVSTPKQIKKILNSLL